MNYEDRPWLKSIDLQVPKDVNLPEIPVYQLLIDSFENYPQNIAVDYYGCEITYSELNSLTNKFANSLVSMGINKGDRVALYMDNCPQYIISFFSILKAGGIVVQASPLLSEQELLFILTDSEAKGIVTLDYLVQKPLSIKDISSLEFIVTGSLYDFLPKNPIPCKPFGIPEKPLVFLEKNDGLYTFMSLLNQSCTFNLISINSKEDVAVIQYSSGTTGVPKGAMISHFNLTSYVILASIIDYKSVSGKEVYPVTLPMSHNYAMFQTVVLPILLGAKILVMIRFHPDECLKVVHLKRPTVFRAVPTILAALSYHPKIREFDLNSIRHWIVGGAPVPSEIINIFRSVSGGNIVEGYGLTEATSGVVINSLYGRTHRGMGMPFMHFDVKIVDPKTGKDVSIGQDGELLLKGPTVSIGYWRNPEETAKTFQDGWLHTGDVVRMTEEGVLQFVDRIKELIIVSGFNVYPTEIENVLYEHPAVLEAAAIGIPDSHQGESVAVFISTKPEMRVSEEEIINICKEKLALYKVPKYVKFISTLPRNATGKISKKEIKRLYINR